MSELTSVLKLQFQNYNQEKLNDAFIVACKDGDLDIIRYLLTSDDLAKNVNINTGFRMACEYGHLPIVKYLLTSKELKNHADIHTNDDGAYQWTCRHGDVEVVRYLLKSPEFIGDTKNDAGFLYATKGGHLEIVCYLLTFSGYQYINFQKTQYNLEWALFKRYHQIVKVMIFSLYKNDMMSYLDNFAKIEEYCKEHRINVQEWQKDMVNEDVVVNPEEELLFV